MKEEERLKVTLPNEVDEKLVKGFF